MRLLHAKTKILEEFFGDYIPQYAILSHTWGQNEVAFKDVQQYGPFGYKSGSTKIDGCCQQARRDSLEYVWIDTCCIDKSSSAELSEAINSMWNWYQVRISASLSFVLQRSMSCGTFGGGSQTLTDHHSRTPKFAMCTSLMFLMA
jgi:hypothetical protein